MLNVSVLVHVVGGKVALLERPPAGESIWRGEKAGTIDGIKANAVREKHSPATQQLLTEYSGKATE